MEGLVTDAKNRPIRWFSVTLTGFDPAPGEVAESRVGESRSELRGAFHWDELAPGSYGIIVQAEELAPWSATVRVQSGKVARGLHAILGETAEGTTAVESEQDVGEEQGGGEPASEGAADADEGSSGEEEQNAPGESGSESSADTETTTEQGAPARKE
jgi:hypothetical protein